MEEKHRNAAHRNQRALVVARIISHARLAALQASVKSAEQCVATDRREDAPPVER